LGIGVEPSARASCGDQVRVAVRVKVVVKNRANAGDWVTPLKLLVLQF